MEDDVELDQDETFYSLAPEQDDGIRTPNVSVYQDTLNATLDTTTDCDSREADEMDQNDEIVIPKADIADELITENDYVTTKLDDYPELDTIQIPTDVLTGAVNEELVSMPPTKPGETVDPDHIEIRCISTNLTSDFTATANAIISPEPKPPATARGVMVTPPATGTLAQKTTQPLSPSMQFISLSDSSDNMTSQFSELGQTEISRFSDTSDATRSSSSSTSRPSSSDLTRPSSSDASRPNSVDFTPSDVVELPLPAADTHKPQVTTPTSYFGSASSPPTFVQQIVPEPDLEDIADSSVDSELWLPTPDTLDLIEQATAGTLDTQFLTKARPNSTVAFVSPAVELVMKYHGEMAAQRLQTTLPPVSESNLRHLVKEGRLLSAVNMLTELLNTAEISVKTIRLWTLRFALLVKLKLYSTAEVEMAMFGNLDNCDLYHEFYPQEGRKGSVIPWSFRLLWSILPLHCPAIGGLYGALDRMYGLVYHLDQALVAGLPYVQEQRVIKYKTSLLVQVAGALAGSGSIQPAIKLLKQIKSFQSELSLPISNAMIRLYYQVGNIYKGEALLSGIQDKLSEEEREMNSGFKCIAHGEYSEAYQHFARVVNLNTANTVASINGAVCLLYLGRLGDSIIQFEGAVKTSLHPMLLFNLVSLYELKTVASTSKKYHLLDMITSKSDWEAFPFECLRL